VSHDHSSSAGGGHPDQNDVRGLAEEYWDAVMSYSPIWATLMGDRRFDEDVPDLSEEREADLADALEGVASRLEPIGPDRLDADERLTQAVVAFQVETDLAEISDRLVEFHVDVFSGPQSTLSALARNVTVDGEEQADALVARYEKVGTYLDSAADRLRAGVTRGRTPVLPIVEHVVAQVDTMLDLPPGDSEFTTAPPPPDGWDEATVDAWRDRLADAVERSVYPALSRYRTCLSATVAPQARPEDKAGLCWLDGGDEIYANTIHRYTTLRRSAEEIHEAGLREIDALADEYRERAAVALDETDLEEIFERLRHDPALRFSTSEEVRRAAESALGRAQTAVPHWFGRLPETPCTVREMAPHEAEHGPIAYYVPPATDGSRPGAFFVNTLHPDTRTRYEAEALAFHEAVPGHHLQIAIAQEREDLPSVRRHSLITAYVEGWALYTERLADEMGLYSGEVERLGMLSFDSWRAGRLVVDTAIHSKGWSRQQAIEYLLENSPVAENNVRNEIDRYIANAGQALAYKTGQQEILRLRREVERRLGDGFDIRDFHDAILQTGPVPLPVLEEVVDASLSRSD
jgi:uncharacterized protein (DUF885 family)